MLLTFNHTWILNYDNQLWVNLIFSYWWTIRSKPVKIEIRTHNIDSGKQLHHFFKSIFCISNCINRFSQYSILLQYMTPLQVCITLLSLFSMRSDALSQSHSPMHCLDIVRFHFQGKLINPQCPVTSRLNSSSNDHLTGSYDNNSFTVINMTTEALSP